MNENNTSVEQSEQKPKKETAAARWRKLIKQQRESGLAVSVYCRERGISAASMFAWRRRLRPASGLSVDPQAGSPTFKPVTVVPETLGRSAEQPDGAIELRLRGGRHLIMRRGFDHQLLAELVQAMESLA
jgi:hypothetical protein